MPLVVSIVAGILTAVLEVAFIELLLNGEAGGPIDFRVPLLLPAIVALVILTFRLTIKHWWDGIISGFLFGIPIAVTFFLLQMDEFDPSHLVREHHADQLRFVGVSVLLISIILLTIRAMMLSKTISHNERPA